jgi:ribosome-associated protein
MTGRDPDEGDRTGAEPAADAEHTSGRQAAGERRFGPAAGGTLQINTRLAIPMSEIVLRTSRSSGPGGQHANVTASRVEAVFDVTSSQALSEAQRRRLLSRAGERIVAVAQDERSQSRNRRLALERLAGRLAAALAVPRKRRATKPTRASRERRLQDKRRAAQRKRDRRPPEQGE